MSSNQWSIEPATWSRTGAAPVTSELTAWLEPLLLGALALAVRLAWLHADLHFDELYHLLAAQGWNETGTPRIADGVYDRALLFTMLIGWCFDMFGQSVAVARLPSVLFGTALVVAVFLWTRAVAGSLAAWVAALLLALSPLAVELSQITRFYALHALVFWVGTTCVWYAVAPGIGARVRIAISASGLLCAMLAAHLQLLTLIGLLGVGLWLAGLLTPTVWCRLRARGLSPLVLTVAALGLAAVALALVLHSGLVEQLWQRYRWTPLWAQQLQDHAHFYHVRLGEEYPGFWPLTAFATLAALAYRPRAGAFCAAVFGVAFLAASFAGMKDDRYLFFALPFLFALWGMALAAVFKPLADGLLELVDRAHAHAAPWLPARPTRYAALAAALLFTLSASGAPASLAFDLARDELPQGPARVTPDWSSARAVLGRWLERADVVITTDELSALYFLGRADIVISGTRLSEVGDAQEFSRDPRTGVAVISAPASVRALMACQPDGLVILSKRDLAFDWSVRPETLAAVVATATQLAPHGLEELQVFWWQTPPTARRACPAAIKTSVRG